MNDSAIESGSRFIASTLHEIRTPIQTVISTTELLEETPLNQEQAEYVRQIQFSANVLLQLANDVLDFTKIRSKEFKLENIPFNIVELTEQVVDLVSIEAFNRGIEIITDIDYSIPNFIMGDPTRVQQIILNLVKNAVKFTSKGYVLIKVRSSKTQLLFQIIDSGIGVKPEKQELIFKDFYQVDASTTRKYGGTGLGLSICKNLVSVMHGQIGVKSNPHGGSNFWFSLPLEIADENLYNTAQDFNPQEDRRILIIDDNKGASISLRNKLSYYGLNKVDTAENGKNALLKMKQAAEENNPYKLAFIDMKMPETDGWALAKQIKEQFSQVSMDLYLLVPEGQMGKDAKMKISGSFAGYLYKPVKQNHLFQILQKVFNNIPGATQGSENYFEKQVSPIPRVEDSLLAQNMKILVAEDHPVNRNLIKTFLTKFGATVYLAENGEEAVNITLEHPEIDIIFMDIQMPVKNGTDATVELRHKHFKGIIIACTANNDPDDFEVYTNLGINDILVKPFKKEAIKKILEKWNTVLSVPEAKEILSLTDINNNAAQLWDVNDFIDTVDSDSQLAVSVLQEYIDQTTKILVQIKQELELENCDFEKLRAYSHTLKGSSGSISAKALAQHAGNMNNWAKKEDKVSFEAARTDFALDFLEFKKVSAEWQATLQK